MKQYKYPGIYTISNNIDGKMYIGKAVNIHTRMSQHRLYLKKNKHSNEHLQRAWNKYGESAFKFELLVKCEEEHLYSEEHYWCNMLNVHNDKYGYNIQPTCPYGLSRASNQTRQKMSMSQRKRPPLSEESKKKISEANKGPKSEEYKQICRERYKRDKGGLSYTGRKHSPETLKKLRQSHLGYKHTEQQKAKISKPVIQYNKNGEYIKEWPSIIEASRQLGISRSVICMNIKRGIPKNSANRKSSDIHYEYIWEYKNK